MSPTPSIATTPRTSSRGGRRPTTATTGRRRTAAAGRGGRGNAAGQPVDGDDEQREEQPEVAQSEEGRAPPLAPRGRQREDHSPTATSVSPAGRTRPRDEQRAARREQLGHRHVGRAPRDRREHGGAGGPLPLHVRYLKSRRLTSNRSATVGAWPPANDAVDRIVEWTAGRPDLDSSPIGVIGRVSRLSRLVDRRLAENFARFGLENWMYDVLATLRRSGPPYELTAGMLVRRRW